MDEIPGLLLLGKLADKARALVTGYLLLISALLTTIVLNLHADLHDAVNVELTLRDVLRFIVSQEGALFFTLWAFVVACHFLLAPIVLNGASYLVRGIFISAGNAFFYSVYIIMTKVLSLKAETKYFFIRENELLNYLVYLLRFVYFNNARIVRARYFGFYRWYVMNVVYSYGRITSNIYFITALLVSTWAVMQHYRFFDVAPLLYYIVAFSAVLQIVNSIIAAWVVNKSGYFVYNVTNSVTQSDSLKMSGQNTEV